MTAPHARIRRLAAQVLLAWLFMLATGVVGACMIAPGAHHGPALMAFGEAAAQADDAHMAVCADEAASELPPASCVKFCVDEASSVPTAKQAFDPWPALGIALVPTLGLSVAEAGSTPANRPHEAPPPRAPVPLHIAYLRLTR